jgi:ABC-type multidrug transport system ATPase subunit
LIESDYTNFEGLRIYGLSKIYIRNKLFCKQKNIRALNDIYLEVPKGELFAIIGHNGAGKSTMINILTGNISPTNGSAMINEFDINYTSVNNLIGLCPQDDILWDELTVREHFEIYAYLRSK